VTEPRAARPEVAPGWLSPPGTELADRVAAVVLAVDGDIALHGGVFGETATYLPGRRVPGVRLSQEATDIHLTLAYVRPFAPTVRQVRAAVAAEVTGPVNITVEDLAPPGTDPHTATTQPDGGAGQEQTAARRPPTEPGMSAAELPTGDDMAIATQPRDGHPHRAG